jgi:hypothetical protein
MSSSKRKCFKDANGSAVHGVVYSVSKPKNSVKAVIARVSFPPCKSPIRCQAGNADATGADQESHI